MARNPALNVLLLLVVVCVWFGVAIWAYGDFAGFFAHPARLALVIGSLVLTLVAAFAPSSGLSTGVREDRGNRWILIPLVLLTIGFTWLAPYDDRRNILTLDGDAVRYFGLVLALAGILLRIAPVFVLGRRFSGLVAIQPEHTLVTDGLYGVVRHPSYLGLMLSVVGWVLVFRSLVGLVLALLLLVPLIGRMNAEERLLQSEFGEPYARYRQRTWRLIPFVY